MTPMPDGKALRETSDAIQRAGTAAELRPRVQQLLRLLPFLDRTEASRQAAAAVSKLLSIMVVNSAFGAGHAEPELSRKLLTFVDDDQIPKLGRQFLAEVGKLASPSSQQQAAFAAEFAGRLKPPEERKYVMEALRVLVDSASKSNSYMDLAMSISEFGLADSMTGEHAQRSHPFQDLIELVDRPAAARLIVERAAKCESPSALGQLRELLLPLLSGMPVQEVKPMLRPLVSLLRNRLNETTDLELISYAMTAVKLIPYVERADQLTAAAAIVTAMPRMKREEFSIWIPFLLTDLAKNLDIHEVSRLHTVVEQVFTQNAKMVNKPALQLFGSVLELRGSAAKSDVSLMPIVRSLFVDSDARDPVTRFLPIVLLDKLAHDMDLAELPALARPVCEVLDAEHDAERQSHPGGLPRANRRAHARGSLAEGKARRRGNWLSNCSDGRRGRDSAGNNALGRGAIPAMTADEAREVLRLLEKSDPKLNVGRALLSKPKLFLAFAANSAATPVGPSPRRLLGPRPNPARESTMRHFQDPRNLGRFESTTLCPAGA